MDEQLKQRLVGAIVLVSLGVVFIPMLLRPSPDPAEPDPGAPGAASRPAFNSRVIPVGESDAPAAPVPADPVPAAPAPIPQPAPEAPAPAPAAARPEPAPPAPEAPAPAPAAARPEPAPPPRVPQPTAAPAAGSGFVVQLGSFANERNAIALSGRLVAKGYKAFVKTVTNSRGTVTRVYVGPSPTREAAAEAVEQLEGETSLRGMVVRYPRAP